MTYPSGSPSTPTLALTSPPWVLVLVGVGIGVSVGISVGAGGDTDVRAGGGAGWLVGSLVAYLTG